MDYEESYLELLEKVIDFGERIKGRNGTTRSIFGAVLTVNSLTEDLFPLLTTRKMHIEGILGELAAFIRGAQTLKEFKDFGCNYWDTNAINWDFNKGLPPEKFEVGKIYGAQWRNFNGVDQLVNLVNGLDAEPTSRRHILTTYNPAEVSWGCLPPCHLLAQYSVRNSKWLSSIVYMRSVDMCVGLPTDVALYSLLQILLANELGLKCGRITFMLGDAHIYENHLKKAEVQLNRMPSKLPTYTLDTSTNIFSFIPSDFMLLDYEPQERIDYAFNV